QTWSHNVPTPRLLPPLAVKFPRQTWQPCATGRRYDLGGDRHNEVSCEFFHSGHILGAAGVIIRAEGKNVFYTGDVNFENQTLIRGAIFPEGSVDVLVMETTRGDSETPVGYTRASEEDRLLPALR